MTSASSEEPIEYNSTQSAVVVLYLCSIWVLKEAKYAARRKPYRQIMVQEKRNVLCLQFTVVFPS